jgi:hypothetical protein
VIKEHNHSIGESKYFGKSSGQEIGRVPVLKDFRRDLIECDFKPPTLTCGVNSNLVICSSLKRSHRRSKSGVLLDEERLACIFSTHARDAEEVGITCHFRENDGVQRRRRNTAQQIK